MINWFRLFLVFKYVLVECVVCILFIFCFCCCCCCSQQYSVDACNRFLLTIEKIKEKGQKMHSIDKHSKHLGYKIAVIIEACGANVISFYVKQEVLNQPLWTTTNIDSSANFVTWIACIVFKKLHSWISLAHLNMCFPLNWTWFFLNASLHSIRPFFSASFGFVLIFERRKNSNRKKHMNLCT